MPRAGRRFSPSAAHGLLVACLCLVMVGCTRAAEPPVADNLLELPVVGSHELHILSPTVLELQLVTTKDRDPARPAQWDFVDTDGNPHLPPEKVFTVLVDGKPVTVKSVGFKRRVLYAPLKKRDLRIGNWLYLVLDSPIAENQSVEVKTTDTGLWSPDIHFAAQADPNRLSPAIHVNEVGYVPGFPKTAMVGYYLGNLGEMDLGTNSSFTLIDVASGATVFHGQMKLRRDRGFSYPVYQDVMEADFTGFKTPGQYRLAVPGLGVSFPFNINEGTAAVFARTYALGIYHQRCGTDNSLPFTRFTHDACHTNLVQIPTMAPEFDKANGNIYANAIDGPKGRPIPMLTNVAASLYPFVNQGTVDVRGGHHDAGDYSRYTIDSAAFIHLMMFAVDNFAGVARLDNLGLPESGDGISDVMQEAKWESDFLANMQDADGGFYFLVYPKGRPYEDDVTPDHGDRQVVWPKNTSATAAAVAALAQCASSPLFKKQYPETAALYLKKAKLGWDFLQRALAAHPGYDAYQRLTQYGDDFAHDDELAWAATELFIATGEPAYRDKVFAWLKPNDPNTRRWTWVRLSASWGNAIRSYAFAARSGRISADKLSPLLQKQCENEIMAAAEDEYQRAQDCAYGSSYPEESKRILAAGWYFSGDAAYDLAVACQLDQPQFNDPRPKYLRAILSNLNYDAGCNPNNITLITGLGWKRQHEIVHQYAENDRRALPPSGIPLDSMQSGFGWLELYQRELGALTFPRDGDIPSPYPIYDRWGDSFNLTQEFVIPNQARAIGFAAWLMTQNSLTNQPWRAAPASIAVSTSGRALTAQLSADGVDLHDAQIVWETNGHEPAFGSTFTITPANGVQWIEAEALLPDGRRVFGVKDFNGK